LRLARSLPFSVCVLDRIGLRGASRYLHADYKDAFELECEALVHVRDKMGLDNVKIMVPFCRTAKEARGVVEVLEKNGLKRGERGLELWCMCEIPANVLAIDDFAAYFDGFSIGSNDLTQLTLGVDRDSGDLASVFDEDDPAVKKAIVLAIEGAHRNGCQVGLCGQAPSDKPDYAAFLVEQGIDSVSVTPDSVLNVINTVARAEKGLPVTTPAPEELKAEIGAAISKDKERAAVDGAAHQKVTK